MRFDVAMMTFDRAPRANFLARTLASLQRAGVFASPLLGSFTLVDSGSPSLSFIYEALNELGLDLPVDSDRRTPTGNAAHALGVAAQGGDWALFLEDDIDVCGAFLESVAGWLQDHGDGYRVFPLGANYSMVKLQREKGLPSWRYPVRQFYGTLAVAMRAPDARAIAQFLAPRAGVQTYDLMMSEWAVAQGITHFLTPAPSFIQHTGRESTIRPGGTFHVYESWPGPKWAYARQARG